MESTAGHDLDEPGVGARARGAARDAGQPVLRRRGVAPSRRVGRDRAARRPLDERLHARTRSGLPEGIREVVGRRLSRLSDAANRALAVGAVIGAQFDLATIEAAGGPTRRRAVRRARPGRAALDRARGPGHGRSLHVRARAHALRAVRGAHDQPARAHALAGRTRDRGAARAPRSTRTSTSSRTTSAKARSRATRSRRSTTAAAPVNAPTPSSRSRARSRHYDRALGALELVDAPDPIAAVRPRRSRWRPRCTTPATSAGATPCSRRPPSARAIGDAERLGRVRAGPVRPAVVPATPRSTPTSSRCSRTRSERLGDEAPGLRAPAALVAGGRAAVEPGSVERRMSLARRVAHARRANRTIRRHSVSCSAGAGRCSTARSRTSNELEPLLDGGRVGGPRDGRPRRARRRARGPRRSSPRAAADGAAFAAHLDEAAARQRRPAPPGAQLADPEQRRRARRLPRAISSGPSSSRPRPSSSVASPA